MKRILIIGDSWAIIPCQLWQLQSVEQKNHYNHNFDNNVLDWLDFRLLSRGHSVSNRSFGGNSNWFQLTQADAYLNAAKKHGFKIDLVIWFHTEVFRDLLTKDLSWLQSLGLEKTIEKIATETYEYATKLHNDFPETEWAIIGGHAPLVKNCEHILDWAKFKLSDYRSSIVGEKVVDCHTLSFTESRWEIIKENNFLTLEEIIKELEKKQLTENMCSDVNKFYDGVHPSCSENIKLSDMIIEHFKL